MSDKTANSLPTSVSVRHVELQDSTCKVPRGLKGRDMGQPKGDRQIRCTQTDFQHQLYFNVSTGTEPIEQQSTFTVVAPCAPPKIPFTPKFLQINYPHGFFCIFCSFYGNLLRRGYCTKTKQEWPDSASTLENIL